MELETWKKLFKGWTVLSESWGEAARWTEERRIASRRCKRTGRHWYGGRKGLATLELNGVKLMAKLTKKKSERERKKRGRGGRN